jgi:hypothetical protein
MASDDKKTKTAPKAEAVAPKKEAAPAKDKVAEVPKADSAKPEAGKAESSEPAAAPKSYSRGEGQKPVSQAYKDNWNAIYGKKKKKR